MQMILGKHAAPVKTEQDLTKLLYVKYTRVMHEYHANSLRGWFS
jgi:hypothetical protein